MCYAYPILYRPHHRMFLNRACTIWPSDLARMLEISWWVGKDMQPDDALANCLPPKIGHWLQNNCNDMTRHEWQLRVPDER